MLRIITSEDLLAKLMLRHMKSYFWNRCIITGISESGKSEYCSKFHKKYVLKTYHSPPFEMEESDYFMFLKYVYLVDRWFLWDRYVYAGKEPVFNTFTHDVLPIIFVRNQFEVSKWERRASYEVQREKYIELAKKLDNSGFYSDVILFDNKEVTNGEKGHQT